MCSQQSCAARVAVAVVAQDVAHRSASIRNRDLILKQIRAFPLEGCWLCGSCALSRLHIRRLTSRPPAAAPACSRLHA